MNLFLNTVLTAVLLTGFGLLPRGYAQATPDSAAEESRSAAPREEAASSAVKVQIRPKQDSPDIVQTGVPVHVKTNEVVPRVVVIQSSATIDGDVDEDVVVIGGEARINGRVGGDVINVGGGIVLGPKAEVGGNAVGVLGGIQMGPDSVIDGDAVGVLGGVRRAEGARVGGHVSNISLDQWIGADGLSLPVWLKATLTEIVLKLRPLSLRVGWVWIVAGLFLGLYALLMVAAPGTVAAVSTTLYERGATAFLMGLLSLPLVALVSFILLMTGVGILVVPFVWAAVFFTGLVGKAGMMQFLGGALGRGMRQELPPLAALFVGAFLLSLLYLIPFLGLLFWMTFALWSLGSALLALIVRFRRETPAFAPVALAPSVGSNWAPPVSAPVSTPVEPPLAPPSGLPVSVPPASAPAPASSEPSGSAEASLSAVAPESYVHGPAPVPLASSVSATTPVVPEALTLPRVALKERLLASLIDWFLLVVFINWFEIDRLKWVLIATYFAGLWVWRGTTIGGIVLRLRVVRLDGRSMDVGTALVRVVGALLGALALGLGYFWAAWDPEKQGWHDKIAGTVVVRTPKPQSLV
jgi:uncharacterized RDD family membrane protein YckC